MSRIVALVGVTLISFSAVFVGLADLSPGSSAFLRAAYGVPLIVVLYLRVRHLDERTRRQRLLAVAAGVCLAIDLNFWHRSIPLVGAGLSTALANLQVVFVGLTAWVLRGERPARAAFVALPVAVVGVYLISGAGRTDAYGANPVAGAVLALLAAVAYTGFLVLLRAGSSPTGSPRGPVMDATIATAAVAFLLGIFDPVFDLRPSWPAHAWMVLLACAATTAWIAITYALPRLPALTTSMLLLAQPCMTLVWGVLIFREDPSAAQWGGAALVMAAIGIASLPGSTDEAVSAISLPVPER